MISLAVAASDQQNKNDIADSGDRDPNSRAERGHAGHGARSSTDRSAPPFQEHDFAERRPSPVPSSNSGRSARPHLFLPDSGTISGAIKRSRFSRANRPAEKVAEIRTEANKVDGSAEEYIPRFRYLPLIAGGLLPIAALLQIPGVTEQWCIRHENGAEVDYQPNPPLLNVAMALSLACQGFASFTLIRRFIEKRVKLNTYFTLFFLIVQEIINIVTLIVFGVTHRQPDGFVFGEAFWTVMSATIITGIVCATLILDYILTPQFAKSGSGLTYKQRSLLNVVIILLCYMGLGALVFSYLMNQTYLNALYYAVGTIETIGFGDFYPVTPGAKIFCVLYATVGIVNVGMVVIATRHSVVEAFDDAYRKRLTQVTSRHRDEASAAARKREKVAEIEQELRDAGLPVYVPTEENGVGGDVQLVIAGGGRKRQQKVLLNEKGLQEWKERRGDQRLADGLTIQPSGELGLNAEQKKTEALATAARLKAAVAFSTAEGDKSEGESYADFQKRLKREELRETLTKLGLTSILFLSFWFLGAGVFSHTESWSFGKAFYFCWLSFTTIGYGDFAPVTAAGRSFFVVWALLGVATMSIFLSVVTEAYDSRYRLALQTGAFYKATRSLETREDRQEEVEADDESARSSIHEVEGLTEEEIKDEHLSPADLAQKILEDCQRNFDPIPLEIMRQAEAFRDNVRYFSDDPRTSDHPPPDAVKQLLDELAHTERMDERMKSELLQIDEPRRVLFFMSYERAFRDLVTTAEKAAQRIARKDKELECLVHRLRQLEGKAEDEAVPGSSER